MQTADKTHKTHHHFSRKYVIITLCLLLVLAVAAFLTSHGITLSLTKNKTEQQLAAFQQKLDGMYEDIQAVLQNKTPTTAMGSVNHIKDAYLLTKMASAALQNNNDIDLAKQLLLLASDHLSGVSGTEVDKAKLALENDQKQLDAVHLPDMQKVQDKLNIMDRLIPVMPVAGIYAEPPAKSVPKDVAVKGKHSWQQVLASIWNDVRSSIKIRKKSDREININDIDIARAQFKLIIEQLRWAAFYHNAEIFQRSILSAQELLPRIFDMQSESVQKFSSLLKELQAVQLQFKLPNLQNSVNALQAILVR